MIFRLQRLVTRNVGLLAYAAMGIALMIGALILTSCAPSTPPAAATASASPSATPTTAASVEASATPDPITERGGECLAYIALQRQAILEKKATGDQATLEAGQKAWRAALLTKMTDEEISQYYASSIAVLDDTPAADLATRAAACVADAPK